MAGRSAALAERYPLQWPAAWPRTRRRREARFSSHRAFTSIAKTVVLELSHLGVRHGEAVISSDIELRLDGLPYSNRRQPDDPGVAVYFMLKGKPHVLACDTWLKVEHNLHAVSLHINAIRAIDRWGVGTATQAFAGYRALPETAGENGSDTWRNVLQFPLDREPNEDQVTLRFRRLAGLLHPDKPGGDAEAFKRLVKARDEALAELAPHQIA